MAQSAAKKRILPPWWRSLALSVGAFALVLFLLLYGMGQTDEGNRQKELESVEKAVNRAVVSCYAMEGFYPPSIDYLIENYVLMVDETRYYIHHEAFASNIYPVIEVYERG